MTPSRSVPLLALSPYKRPLKQLGPSSHMVTLAPALAQALAPALPPARALALALALTLTQL